MRRVVLILAFSLIACPRAGVAQGNGATSAKPTPAKAARLPFGPSVEERLAWDSVYVRSLEAANKQLSNWTSALAVAVGVVAVLVGVLAIVSGITLFRQGSEYKATIREAIAKYQAVIDALVVEAVGREASTLKTALSKSLAEAKDQLAAAHGDDAQKLQARITELEKELVTLQKAEPSELERRWPGLTSPVNPITASMMGSPIERSFFTRSIGEQLASIARSSPDLATQLGWETDFTQRLMKNLAALRAQRAAKGKGEKAPPKAVKPPDPAPPAAEPDKPQDAGS